MLVMKWRISLPQISGLPLLNYVIDIVIQFGNKAIHAETILRNPNNYYDVLFKAHSLEHDSGNAINPFIKICL